MSPRDQTGQGKLDHVDRRSQLGTSRAMRARDVSRPDETDLAEALAALESGQQRGASGPTSTPTPIRRKKRTAAAEARRSARSD